MALSAPLLGTISTSFSFVCRVYLPAKIDQIGSTCSIASLVALLSGSVNAALRRQTERHGKNTEGISIKAVWRVCSSPCCHTSSCGPKGAIYNLAGAYRSIMNERQSKNSPESNVTCFVVMVLKILAHCSQGGCHVVFRCTLLNLDIYILEKRQNSPWE